MSQYYNEYHNFKLHTKLINLEYFKENEIKHDILKWMIEKFINLDNHFIFVDYFIYALNNQLNRSRYRLIDKPNQYLRRLLCYYHLNQVS